VSRSFLDKFNLLKRLERAGYPINVTGFTHASEFTHPDLVVTESTFDLLRCPRFAGADVHVFEFAMCYGLFDALMLVDAPTIVIDHNTTPPELVHSPAMRAACERACLMRNNLDLADHVATVGEFTREQLLSMGFNADRVSVLHLPPANVHIGKRRFVADGDHDDTPARLLYVGRLVRAKGLSELLTAAEVLWRQKGGCFTLTVAGSSRFAEPTLVEQLKETAWRHAEDGLFFLVEDAGDDEIAALYGASDAVVMPSHHEGYCVPVVEAMTSGCYVIGSDAGNIPNVMGGLGTVFRAWEMADLVEAMEGFVGRLRKARGRGAPAVLMTDSGELEETEWRRAVRAHMAGYSQEAFDRGFVALLHHVLEGRECSPAWLADLARSQQAPELAAR